MPLASNVNKRYVLKRIQYLIYYSGGYRIFDMLMKIALGAGLRTNRLKF